MSLLGMPWAMINLGCEMVYILHQRLNAQGIPSDRCVKVLQDIIRTMFEPGFLADKLFVAQDMYSLSSTRKVFDKIAHSSIMKLSENRCGDLAVLRHSGAQQGISNTASYHLVASDMQHGQALRLDGHGCQVLPSVLHPARRHAPGLQCNHAAKCTLYHAVCCT